MQISYEITYMWNLKYHTNDFIYETETDLQTQRTDLWLTKWEGGWERGRLRIRGQQVQIRLRRWYMNPPANAGDLKDASLIQGSGKSPAGEHGNPLQYSCLENPSDRGAWRATAHRVIQSQTQLSDCMHARDQIGPISIISPFQDL